MDRRAFYLELLEKLEHAASVSVETELSGDFRKRFTEQRNETDGCFCETLTGHPTAVICGGGHVAQALAPVLSSLDWAVAVMDDRPEFLTRERFPTAQRLIALDFSALEALRFPAGAFYAVMTRGHQADYACLRAALRKDYGYMGMIGSRGKVKGVFDRLRAEGVSEEVLAGIHAPIGHMVGAQSPAEIAVCIACQMIEVYRAMPRSYLDSRVAALLRSERGPLVMVTVIKKSGSAPRDVGTRMLVRPDGSFAGTIGGGAVEAAAAQDALACLASQKPAVRDYDVSASAAAALGMVCGGRVRVLFEALEAAE